MAYIYLENNSIDPLTLDTTTLGYFDTRQLDWQSMQVVYGCTNRLANNYNPNATQDNWTCDNNTILHSWNVWNICSLSQENCNLSDLWITSISEDTFVDYSNILYLVLGSNQIESIESWDFNGLSNLVELYLYSNQIESIESWDFNWLSNLNYLSLSDNQVTSIEIGSFDNLPAMTYIYLDNNSIDVTTLDATTLGYFDTRQPNRQTTQIIYGCTSRSLANNYNPNATVDNWTCDSNTILHSGNVWSLCDISDISCSLEGQWITAIAPDTFVGYSNITYLRISRNQIASIESWAFNGLSSLETLILYNSQIENIESWAFHGLPSLNSLELNSNQIQNIENWAFNWLSNLIYLDISDNQIMSIESWTFNWLSSLENLNLYNNQIANIESWDFNWLSNLTYLYLHGNCLNNEDSTLTNYLDTIPWINYSNQYVCMKLQYAPSTPTTGLVTGSLVFRGPTSKVVALETDNSDMSIYDHTFIANGSHTYNYSDIVDNNWYLWTRNMWNPDIVTGVVTWIQDTIAPTFDIVDTSLISSGIIGNLDQVDISNYTAFSGLTFEKRTNPADANTALGSITFNSALDLSDPETRSFLQDLWSRLSISSDGTISLDFRGIWSWVALKWVWATIKFYGLDKLGFGADATSADILAKLNVYDDYGILLDKSSLLANSGTYVWACGVGETECYTFTIWVNHFTTYKISSNTTNNNTSHWGWGGSSVSKDVCVNGDYSSSYYDGSCGTQPVVVSTWVVPLIIAPKIDPISDELIAAYKRAYIKDITTMDTLSWARIQGFLTRWEMAKMIVNYAINILWKKIDTTKQASFKDLALESQEMKGYINQAYQLWLMGVNIVNFNPQWLVTRGEFATVLARLLYGEEATGTGFYYDKPIEILRQNEIIKNTNPLMQEVRWYVMLMLMRSSQ
jgi:Leucine-rich repeat (LRR) protein